MAKRRGGGLLGLFAFIIVILLIVAYLQKHHFQLPDLGGHSSNGSLPASQFVPAARASGPDALAPMVRPQPPA